MDRILSRCDSLRTVDRLVCESPARCAKLQGRHLGSWVAQAQTSGITQLALRHRPAQGLRRRRNGLILPWSSRAIQDNVGKLQTIKRQMYGRAYLDLLRRRVILAE